MSKIRYPLTGYNKFDDSYYSKTEGVEVKTGGNLHAHHLKQFKFLIKEVEKNLPLMTLYDGAMIYSPMWDISNGITLCKNCHRKIKHGGINVRKENT